MTIRDWSKADQRVSDSGSVIDVRDTGGIFCGNDARPFVPKSVGLAKTAEKARRLRARKRLKASTVRASTGSPLRTSGALLVPLNKAHLIMSVMKDLDMPLPSKVKHLNRRLRQLIKDGVISAGGDPNTEHPVIQRWHARLPISKT